MIDQKILLPLINMHLNPLLQNLRQNLISRRYNEFSTQLFIDCVVALFIHFLQRNMYRFSHVLPIQVLRRTRGGGDALIAIVGAGGVRVVGIKALVYGT